MDWLGLGGRFVGVALGFLSLRFSLSGCVVFGLLLRRGVSLVGENELGLGFIEFEVFMGL